MKIKVKVEWMAFEGEETEKENELKGTFPY